MTCKQMKYFALALGVILLVPAAEITAQSRTRNEKSARCRVSASSPERPATRRRRPSFSAAEIMDIQLQTYVSRRMAGHHSLELKVYTPNGNLYQSMTLPFDADAPAPDDGDRMARRFLELSAVLPVAGTSIVSSSMYGTWKVEAYLDDNERACSSPTKFVIEP